MKIKNVKTTTTEALKDRYSVGDVIKVTERTFDGRGYESDTYNMVIVKVNRVTIHTMVEEVYNDVNRNKHCDNIFILNEQDLYEMNARKVIQKEILA